MGTLDIKLLSVLIADVDEQLKPLIQRKQELSDKLRTAESIEFIRVNNITKADVQRCDDKGMGWMGDIYRFGKWMEKNSQKPWCCWNGLIYLSSEVINQRMSREAPGRYEDLLT